MQPTETLAMAPFPQPESPEDTLARLVAVVNGTKPLFEIKPLEPFLVMGLGRVGVAGEETPGRHAAENVSYADRSDRRAEPHPDDNPLITRRFNNDMSTMERVLVGLRNIPDQEPEPEAPHLDDNPLITRRFNNDYSTMERVLVGLRRLPEQPASKPAAQSYAEPLHVIANPPFIPGKDGARRPGRHAAAPEADPRETHEKDLAVSSLVRVMQTKNPELKLRPATPSGDTPKAANSTPAADTPEIESITDRKLRAAGFDLSGERLKMSRRLERQLIRNPDGEYRGLRRNRESVPVRVGRIARRLGSLVLRNKTFVGGSATAMYAGMDLVLAQLQR